MTEVAFVRFDAEGVIVSSGAMHRDHVEAERAAGERILVVDRHIHNQERFRVVDGALVPHEAK